MWLNDNVKKEYIYIYSLCLFLFLLPFEVRYNNIGLIALVLGWAINFKGTEFLSYIKDRSFKRIFIAICLFYVYFILRGFDFSSETYFYNNALVEYGKKIALILLPILLNIKAIRKHHKLILYSFVGGVFLAIIICLSNAVYVNFKEGLQVNRGFFHFNAWYFSNLLLTKPINFHPTLFSFAVSIVLHICVLQILNLSASKVKLFKSKAIASAVAILMFMFMLMLSSRNVLLFSTVSIFILVIKYIINTKKYRYSLYFILAITGISAFELSINHVNKQRIVDLLSINKNPTEKSFGGSSFRLASFNALYQEIIKDNWIFGIGSGGDQTQFDRAYLKHGLSIAAKEHYNAHNQYLETLIDNGIVGLLLLLAIYFVALKTSYNTNSYLGLIVVYLLASLALTESILERQKGIWLFTTVLFIFIAKLENLKEKVEKQ
ncbi:O-antigen ligase family protein [Fulvivirga sp. 29W222]|uniref:O-antigen ligase family protein n=1 Tax=Fulvivirga marina TaxID=2494733 RepID=A0A937KE89_9BACT|nr:O-antigen ligase family protein [Fulvivirga marina]MBL6449866.1 O-antigen ligase family protein [Fulvivirga marina]